jgi:N-acetylmuramoyl-L-alanine amidase
MWLCLALLSIVHAKSMTIAIDAGHGGSDHGATYKHVHESTITLGIAKELQKIIEDDNQFSSFLVRDNDKSMELHDRVKKARAKESDLFISIHANSSPDPKSHGMEIYFRNELEPDQESLRLAHQENQFKAITTSQKLSDIQSITQDLNRSTTTVRSYELSWHVVDNWRVPFSSKRRQPIKQGPFHVIHQGIPSVLVEVGFVTNEKEAMRLLTPVYQKETAMAIYNGLKDYKETLDKGQTKALK